jgi:DNA-3-methyladenine glycosylase I
MAARLKVKRCRWADGADAEMQRYHDREWGVPTHSDRRLFEFLILEGAQAGLSWSTILHKRAAYRRAFLGFDISKVARMNAAAQKRLLNDPGIVRNRLKIRSAIANAKAALAIKAEHGSFGRFLWSFVGEKPIARKRGEPWHDRTRESDAMSDALRSAGLSFVGSTICYAFMQAVGMVNDHETTCFRYQQIRKLATRRE